MNVNDLTDMIAADEAADKLFDLFRQGLTNAVAIPEVETEGDQAAHQILGCTNYSALLVLYGVIDDLVVEDSDDQVQPSKDVVEAIRNIADDHLRKLCD
ncbi:MAG TPA: hypothetical protein VJ777_13480, partial [Mycobacterium sp.]|nr:hypothetical protein [Mycobacterium sp.]